MRKDIFTACRKRKKVAVNATKQTFKPKNGRAIAQAISRRLPTAAALVQNRVWSCGIL
jgi:hypothetical protein